jgi:hypothetical protein
MALHLVLKLLPLILCLIDLSICDDIYIYIKQEYIQMDSYYNIYYKCYNRCCKYER